MALSTLERITRQSIKRFIYSQLALLEASKLLRGDSKPLIRFTVEDSPPSIYFNFRIRDDRVAALSDSLRLPSALSLTKIRCRAEEVPFHALTLNVYRVSGITNGLRAEWSVYVQDGSGKPRYLIVEARSSQPSMDPVDLITRASRVVHDVRGSELVTCVESDGHTFSSRLTLANPTQQRDFGVAGEWIEANDFIYWRNGVCDRAFYDGALANGKMWEVRSEDVQITDETSWASYLEPAPEHVVMLGGRIELVISPWWNV